MTAARSDADAVSDTRRLVHELGGPTTFVQVRALSQAAEALSLALQTEERAEVLDQESEQEAVLAQMRLLREVRARVEPVDSAARRAKVAALLEGWTDPYAADAAGRPLLDAARALIRGDGLLVDLLGAIEQMRSAGLARDRAAAHRAQAIVRRVAARKRWDGAHSALRHEAGLPPSPEPPSEVDHSAWFTDGA